MKARTWVPLFELQMLFWVNIVLIEMSSDSSIERAFAINEKGSEFEYQAEHIFTQTEKITNRMTYLPIC